MKFPINRNCPISGEEHLRILAYLSAESIAAANATYRADFAETLGIAPDDEFPILESQGGFVYSGWLPPNDFLCRVYEDVIDHSKTITETVGYRRALLAFGSAFLHIVEREGPWARTPLRLLDFGCGYGALARMLAGREICSFGYEPSFKRRVQASGGPVEIFDTLEGIGKAGPFDLIICTEVLEHVSNPRETLQFLRRHASPMALLAITVPQCESKFINSALATFQKDRCLPRVINPWEHLNYFSARTLIRLLAEEGFEVVNDFGRASIVREVSMRAGDTASLRHRVCNGLRLIKRALTASRSTQVFCKAV